MIKSGDERDEKDQSRFWLLTAGKVRRGFSTLLPMTTHPLLCDKGTSDVFDMLWRDLGIILMEEGLCWRQIRQTGYSVIAGGSRFAHQGRFRFRGHGLRHGHCMSFPPLKHKTIYFNVSGEFLSQGFLHRHFLAEQTGWSDEES